MTIDETVSAAAEILFESYDERETMSTNENKRGPGRPRLDPSGVQAPYCVKLSPEERAFLRKYGGSVNGGVRKLVTEKMARMVAGS